MRVTPLGAIDEMPPTVAMAPVADGRTLAVGEPPGEGCPICVTLFEPTDEMRPTVGIAPLDSEERLAVDEACVTLIRHSAPDSHLRCSFLLDEQRMQVRVQVRPRDRGARVDLGMARADHQRAADQ